MKNKIGQVCQYLSNKIDQVEDKIPYFYDKMDDMCLSVKDND